MLKIVPLEGGESKSKKILGGGDIPPNSAGLPTYVLNAFLLQFAGLMYYLQMRKKILERLAV